MYAIDGGAESEGNFSVFAVDVDSAEPPRASAQVIAVGSFRRHGNASVVCCLRFRIVFFVSVYIPRKMSLFSLELLAVLRIGVWTLVSCSHTPQK